jgi:hypothetical protein
MSNEADISKLRIVVESKTDGIVEKLTSLASALTALRNASKSGFKGLAKCADAITNLADAVSKINDADVDRLERMANAVAKMSGVKFSSSFFRAMGVNGGTAKGGAMTIGSRFSSGRGWTWNDNGSSSGNAVFLGGGGGGGSGSPPIDIDSLFGSGNKGGSFKMPKFFANFKAKMSGFLGSVLRIAMYRLIRRALMLIVNAFKEGLKNAKEWSRINNTQLYESMKRLSAAGLAMKNALGAALGELIISIQPALEMLALKIADIGNSLANMFASLRGADTYQKAITDVNKLAAAQERLNRALLGFDEIHKLSGQENVSDYFTMEETDKTQAGYSVAKIAGIATLAIALKALLSNGSIGSLFGKVASWFGGGAAAAGGGATLSPFLQTVFGGGSAAGAAGGGVLGTLTLAAPWLAVIGAVAAVGIGSMEWMKSHRAEVQAFADSLASKYTIGNQLTPHELSTAEIIRYNMEHPNYQLPLTDSRLTGTALLDAIQDYRDLVYQTQHTREAVEDAVLKIIVENPNGQTLTQTEMYYNDILNGRVGQVKIPGSPYIGR